MKREKLLFWIPNGLLIFMMMASGIMYLVQPAEVIKVFGELGYPEYTVYFNACAKILGGIALLLPQFPRWVKEFAYAGYLFIMLLALQALILIQPQNAPAMAIFLVLWGLSYWRFSLKK